MLNEEALRQFSYLSSLLAGFSVMVTVSLLSLVGLISTISALLFVLVFNLIVAAAGILVLSAGP